jgi:two-component system chemotaxis sensor kinase CheA
MPENVSLEKSGEELLRILARELEIMSGILYIKKRAVFEAVATYALASAEEPYSFREGEGLPGQAARSRQIMVLTKLPEDYLQVCSGLGKAKPAYLAIIPFIYRNRTIAVLECSGYRHDPHEIESMFRIFSRDLMEKISPNLR